MKGPENLKDRLKKAKKEAKLQKADQKSAACDTTVTNEHTVSVSVSNKHPVSALMEYCQKRGWPEPRFTEEMGRQGFRFSVQVN